MYCIFLIILNNWIVKLVLYNFYRKSTKLLLAAFVALTDFALKTEIDAPHFTGSTFWKPPKTISPVMPIK
ncbi:hypothetical protein GCM10027577_14990 [Spirosoma fluminis]